MDTKTSILTDKLNEDERLRWTELNEVVKKGLKGLLAAGQALVEIRDRRLYREEFGTWESYCRDMLGYSKAQANRLISGAEVLTDLAPIGAKMMPARESHLRELARLPEPELRVEAWQNVLNEPNSDVTASTVRKAVSTVRKKAGLPVEKVFKSTLSVMKVLSAIFSSSTSGLIFNEYHELLKP